MTVKNMTRLNDLTGKRFGMWSVIERADNDSYGKARWKCICDCGNVSIVSSGNLISGKSKCCGCERKAKTIKISTKHGMCHERIYRIYRGMVSRCNNKNNYSFKNYGGRGISVCDNWLGDSGFENFYKWSIENGYSEELTIDRIDVNGNYEPDNCRWTTVNQQANNMRTNRVYVFNNESHTLSEWAKISGINYLTLRSRIDDLGWEFKKALTEPVQFQRKKNRANIIRETIVRNKKTMGGDTD